MRTERSDRAGISLSRITAGRLLPDHSLQNSANVKLRLACIIDSFSCLGSAGKCSASENIDTNFVVIEYLFYVVVDIYVQLFQCTKRETV